MPLISPFSGGGGRVVKKIKLKRKPKFKRKLKNIFPRWALNLGESLKFKWGTEATNANMQMKLNKLTWFFQRQTKKNIK